MPSRSLRSLSSLKSRSPSWTPHARLCDPARTHHRNRLRSDQNRDHEVAHVLLHGDKGQLVDTDRPERSTREVEAELTAYLVKAALGIDKGQEFSRGYIQNWLAGAQAEKVRFPAVFGAVDKVLKAGRPEPEASGRAGAWRAGVDPMTVPFSSTSNCVVALKIVAIKHLLEASHQGDASTLLAALPSLLCGGVTEA